MAVAVVGGAVKSVKYETQRWGGGVGIPFRPLPLPPPSPPPPNPSVNRTFVRARACLHTLARADRKFIVTCTYSRAWFSNTTEPSSYPPSCTRLETLNLLIALTDSRMNWEYVDNCWPLIRPDRRPERSACINVCNERKERRTRYERFYDVGIYCGK